MPALLNRAGVIVVSCGGREVWAGGVAVNTLYTALAALPYTVIWATPHPHLRPHITTTTLPLHHTTTTTTLPHNTTGEAKFIFKKHLPLNGVLGRINICYQLKYCYSYGVQYYLGSNGLRNIYLVIVS